MNFYVWNFNIRVIEKGNFDVFFSTEGVPVLNIMSATSLLSPNAPSILADPFLFVYNEELYLFYEHQDKWIGGKGRLCMRKTKDLKIWTDEVDVLVEPFHLSYPWVFEDNGKVYMLPETGNDNSIRLYVATDDSLTKWKLVKKIVDDGLPWKDSVIYGKDGYYYLFTSHNVHHQQEQHLFVANDLMGPYTEHPMSPIYTGADGGRNAGSIIEYEGGIYRPVQVCIHSYGEQTSIMRIETLNPTEYKETLYKNNIVDTHNAAYREGGHQFNPVQFKGKWIVATDNRIKNYNFIETFRRIWKVVR